MLYIKELKRESRLSYARGSHRINHINDVGFNGGLDKTR